MQVGLAAHNGGEGGSEVASGVGIVRQAAGHEQGAEVGVAEAERTVVVGVAGDPLSRIAGVVDEDIHCRDHDADRVAIGGDIEVAGGVDKLQQVERREVAGRVVEEHVFGARIGRIDATGILRRMPLVDGGVVLHARVAALPGGLGDLLHDVAGFVGLDGEMVLHGVDGEVAIAFDGLHELVGDADGVVGVLEEDRGVGFRIGA